MRYKIPDNEKQNKDFCFFNHCLVLCYSSSGDTSWFHVLSKFKLTW